MNRQQYNFREQATAVNGELPYSVEPAVVYTGTGGQVAVLRKKMPIIAETLKAAVFYLYPTEDAARNSERSGGTGFFVFVTSPTTGKKYYYAVTNRHVIEKGLSPVIRVNTFDGKFDTINLTIYDWQYHPNGADVAVAFIEDDGDNQHIYVAMPTTWFVTQEVIQTAGIYLGNDVYMLGRFIHHAGRTFNMPSARSGIISAMPHPSELIPIKDGCPQEAYLVEMRSLSGYSGSPTFHNLKAAEFIIPFKFFMETIYNIEVPEDTRLRDEGDYVWVLGIDAGNFPIYEDVIEIANGNENKTPYKAINHSGFSVVIPAWKIQETLDRENFVTEREKKDKQSEHMEGVARTDSSDAPAFTRHSFEEALKQSSQRIASSETETTETSDTHRDDDCI